MTVARRYVVTVDRRGARLSAFLAQRGADAFEVFDGVDLRASTWEALADLVDEPEIRRRYGRRLSPGEVGCALSHRSVMALIAADETISSDEVALVVEDDAVLHPDLDAVLPWLVSQPFDVMPLHHGGWSLDTESGRRLMERVYPLSPLAKRTTASGHVAGFTTPESWMLAVGYLVRKRAAHHIVQHESGLVGRVADDYRVLGDLGLRVCQVRPSLIWESGIDSVITPTGRVISAVDATELEIVGRLRRQGDNSSLHGRKIAWLVTRDLSSRLPWSIRHSSPMESLRRSWNRAMAHLPLRVRRIFRPGAP